MEIFIQELRLLHCLVVTLRLKEALIRHAKGERGRVEGRKRDQRDQ